MKNMNKEKSILALNLATLRTERRYTLEKIAELIGVTRQAVSKWETGVSVPDIVHCDRLAALYDVTLDDLVHFDQKKEGVSVPPKGKHLFGTVQLGERGQIVIPKKAREMLGLKHGDTLVVLGESSAGTAGIALMQSEVFMRMAHRETPHIQREDEKQ